MKSNSRVIPFFRVAEDTDPALVVPALLEWSVLLGELKHVRDGLDPHQHEVQVRRLVWTDDGWPLVSPQPWAGDHEADDTTTWPSDPADLLGEWEVLTFAGDPDPFDPDYPATVSAGLVMVIAQAGTIVECGETGEPLRELVRHARDLHEILIEQLIAAERVESFSSVPRNTSTEP